MDTTHDIHPTKGLSGALASAACACVPHPVLSSVHIVLQLCAHLVHRHMQRPKSKKTAILVHACAVCAECAGCAGCAECVECAVCAVCAECAVCAVCVVCWVCWVC